jgi:hypothetical protein
MHYNPMFGKNGLVTPHALVASKSFRVSEPPVTVAVDTYEDKTVPKHWNRLSVGAGHAGDLYRFSHNGVPCVAKRMPSHGAHELRFYQYLYSKIQDLQAALPQYVQSGRRRLEAKLQALQHVLPRFYGVQDVRADGAVTMLLPLTRNADVGGVAQDAQRFLVLQNIRADFEPMQFAGIDIKMGTCTANMRELGLQGTHTTRQRVAKVCKHWVLDHWLTSSHRYGFRTEGLDGLARPMGYHKGMKKQFRKEERACADVNLKRLFQCVPRRPLLKKQLLNSLLRQLGYVQTAIEALGPCVMLGSSLYIAVGMSASTGEWQVSCKMIDFAHSHVFPNQRENRWVLQLQESYKKGLTHLQTQVRKMCEAVEQA